jgi:hypothetical protein
MAKKKLIHLFNSLFRFGFILRGGVKLFLWFSWFFLGFFKVRCFSSFPIGIKKQKRQKMLKRPYVLSYKKACCLPEYYTVKVARKYIFLNKHKSLNDFAYKKLRHYRSHAI